MSKKNASKASLAVKSVAVIDIGSNEISLKIGELSKDKIKIIESLSFPLSIGRDTFNMGKISFEKADKACSIIKNYLNVAIEYDVDYIKAVATTALREAENKDYILDQIRLKTGLSVDVIDNQEEKFYIYKMMLSLLDKEVKQSALMVYIGSGNLGISLLDQEKIPFIQNIRIGSLRISELFEEVYEYSQEFYNVIEDFLKSFTDTIEITMREEIPNFIATGSEICTIADLCGAEKNGKVYNIKKESFEKLYDEIKYKNANVISAEYNISIDRAELLFPAMCIYNNMLSFSNATSIIAPVVSLADELIWEILYPKNAENLNKEFYKSTILCAKFYAEKFKYNETHSVKVEKFALKIFDKIKKIHGLSFHERLLLQTAAILHDIGKFINIKNHYTHSYNIIRGIDIIGLTVRDVEIIANLSIYHSRIIPSLDHANYKILSPKDRVLVSKLSAILRLGDALDRSHEQKFDDIEVKLIEDELLITVSTEKNIELEAWSFKEKGEFFEEVFGIKATMKKKKVL